MKIKLIVVGKTNASYLKTGESNYEDRLKHYCKFEDLLIPQIKNSGKLSNKYLKIKEGKLILKNMHSMDQYGEERLIEQHVAAPSHQTIDVDNMPL